MAEVFVAWEEVVLRPEVAPPDPLLAETEPDDACTDEDCPNSKVECEALAEALV